MPHNTTPASQSDDALVESLRAWAPMVSSGYECPAAGQVLLEAADAIEALNAREAAAKADAERLASLVERGVQGDVPSLYRSWHKDAQAALATYRENRRGY